MPTGIDASSLWQVLMFLIASGILGGVATIAWYARGFKASISEVNSAVQNNQAVNSGDIRELKQIVHAIVEIKNDHVTDIAILKERWQSVHQRLKVLEKDVQAT